MAKKSGKKKEAKGKADPPASMKAYITLIQKQATEELKHHTTVLAEHMEDRIAGISEEFVDFRRKLDSHTEMLVELAEDVSVLKEDVSVLKEDVSVLKTDVSVLKEDVSVLKEDVSVLKVDMKSVKDGLKKKVDREEFTGLDRRVRFVEGRAR